MRIANYGSYLKSDTTTIILLVAQVLVSYVVISLIDNKGIKKVIATPAASDALV